MANKHNILPLGWILVHSKKVFGPKEKYKYESPQEELRAVFEPGVEWGWSRPRRMKDDKREHRLLMAWNHHVFGEARGSITGYSDDPHEFAFVLSEYWPLDAEIPFSRLDMGDRESHHRDLIRLDERILTAYKSEVSSQRRAKFRLEAELEEVESEGTGRRRGLSRVFLEFGGQDLRRTLRDEEGGNVPPKVGIHVERR